MVKEFPRHGLLLSRVSRALQVWQDQADFGVISGDMNVIAHGAIHGAGVAVFRPAGTLGVNVAPEPVMVVEPVTPCTWRVDSRRKNVDDAATPPSQHCVRPAEKPSAAVVCSCTPGGWTASEFKGAGSIPLPAVGVDLPFDETYQRINTASIPS